MKPSFIHLVLGLAIALLQAKPATAQTLTFLGDNNVDHPAVSNAGEFTKAGDHVFFWAEGAYGKELYRADSSGAVELVKDITPGRASTDISRLVAAGDKLFFLTGTAFGLNVQLWTSDGTAEGTKRVKSLPSSNSYIQRPLVALGEEIFFTGSNGLLFKTDGTDAGTTIAAGLRTPIYASYGVYKGSLYVGASTAQDTSINLYRTDGTLAGTHLVHPEPGTLDQLVEVDGTLYFSESRRLWKTDGTAAGTVRVTGEAAENVGVMRAAGQKLIFEARTLAEGYELWVTTPDSTEASLVKDFTPGGIGTSVYYLTSFKDKLFFRQNDRSPKGLWITDGTDAGTTIVREYTPDWYLGVTPMVVAGDTVFFEAHTSAGTQLWMTDGTYAGTKSYRDFEAVNDNFPRVVGNSVETHFYACLAAPGDYRKIYRVDLATSEPTALHFVSGNPAGLNVENYPLLLNGKAIYTGNDVENGNQLWVTDGTREGTFRLTDFDQTPGNPVFPYGTLIGRLDDSALFLTFRNGNTQLWKTKGNPGDVELVQDVVLHSSHITNLVTGGPVAYMFEYSDEPLGTGTNFKYMKDIWRTDGTAAGTYPLNIPPEMKIIRPMYYTADSHLYISIATDAHGIELWKIDHKSGSLSLVKDIHPGTTGSLLLDRTPSMYGFQDEVYFYANDGIHGTELWKTDGTEGGTVLVKDIGGGAGIDGGTLASAFTATTSEGEFLYFSHDGFWRTDGTEAGTIRLADNGPQSLFHMAQWKGKIYFSGYSIPNGTALWVTDGSPEGTRLLKDINPAAGLATLDTFAATNTAVFFSADDGQHGVELWMTDGTAEGTCLVYDINPGPLSWGPQYTYALGDYIFTTAFDGVSGREIWYSSAEMGTAARLADINPGPQDSQAKHFAPLGDAIVFNAFSAETGFDLYSITAPMSQSAAAEDWALFE